MELRSVPSDRAAILQLLMDKSDGSDGAKTKAVIYEVYAPEKSIQKKTTLAQKNAINKIAYTISYQDTLQNILLISKELMQKLDLSDAKLDDYLKKQYSNLVSANQNTQLSLANMHKMASFFHETTTEFSNLINPNPKGNPTSKLTLPTATSDLTTELMTWMDAAHFYLSNQINRQKMLKLINDKTGGNKTVPHPVKERNQKIKEGMHEAIVAIGEMDPKESLPPILSMLEEMSKLSDVNQEQNRESLSYVVTYLSRADEMQYKDFTESLAEIQKNGLLAKMIPALEKLVKEIEQLQINAILKPLAEELAIWLEGLYFHTAKKQTSGWLKLPDPEDVALRAATFGKVNKLMVATYYHEAALAIEAHLKKLAETKNIDLAESPKSIPLPKQENHKKDEPKKTEIVLPVLPQGERSLTLDDFKTRPIESKFPLLMVYVDTNELTPIQYRAMEKFKPEIISTLGEYINDPWRSYLPSSLFKRPHTRALQRASDDIENSEDPAYWINRLYKLWNYLKSKKSYDAFSKVTLLLNTTCDLLDRPFVKNFNPHLTG